VANLFLLGFRVHARNGGQVERRGQESHHVVEQFLHALVVEWRGKLIEEVASTDDALMEKFFEDPDSITADELLAAIEGRKAIT